MNSLEPNCVRVYNLKEKPIIYVAIEKFDMIKSMLDENSTYEYVYKSPNNIIYRTELFNLCQ